MKFLEEVYTDEEYIMCDNDHPRIWLQMGKEEYVICGYCNKKFNKKPKWGSSTIDME
tara:strand:+ start:423 stop:593 length:171 start_codon:yes stop_codon:yes gene_type:complete